MPARNTVTVNQWEYPPPRPEDVVFEAQVAFDDLPLIVTREQLEDALGQWNTMIVKIPCMDLLKLTTSRDLTVDHIIETAPDGPEVFNLYALTGNDVEMPMLVIDLHEDRVVGHEGRHRAASVIREVGRRDARMYISIHLEPSPEERRKYEEILGRKRFNLDKMITSDDIPEVLRPQAYQRWLDGFSLSTKRWEPVLCCYDEMKEAIKALKKGKKK